MICVLLNFTNETDQGSFSQFDAVPYNSSQYLKWALSCRRYADLEWEILLGLMTFASLARRDVFVLCFVGLCCQNPMPLKESARRLSSEKQVDQCFVICVRRLCSIEMGVVSTSLTSSCHKLPLLVVLWNASVVGVSIRNKFRREEHMCKNHEYTGMAFCFFEMKGVMACQRVSSFCHSRLAAYHDKWRSVNEATVGRYVPRGLQTTVSWSRSLALRDLLWVTGRLRVLWSS